jgi:hypothetical protein
MLGVSLACGGRLLRAVVCPVVAVLYVLVVQRAVRIVGVLLSRLAVNPTRPHASGYTPVEAR